jgi:hypothetical protein
MKPVVKVLVVVAIVVVVVTVLKRLGGDTYVPFLQQEFATVPPASGPFLVSNAPLVIDGSVTRAATQAATLAATQAATLAAHHHPVASHMPMVTSPMVTSPMVTSPMVTSGAAQMTPAAYATAPPTVPLAWGDV